MSVASLRLQRAARRARAVALAAKRRAAVAARARAAKRGRGLTGAARKSVEHRQQVAKLRAAALAALRESVRVLNEAQSATLKPLHALQSAMGAAEAATAKYVRATAGDVWSASDCSPAAHDVMPELLGGINEAFQFARDALEGAAKEQAEDKP